MANKEWVEQEDKTAFMQLMFIVGKAVGIHPWSMQELIEQETYPGIGFVRTGFIEENYETRRANREELPTFAQILEKVAWIGTATDGAQPPDDYLSRLNMTIREYDDKYLGKSDRIHRNRKMIKN